MALKLLTELPNEIITQIILQLSPEEITSLDLVSKQFRNLTLQPTLWQQFTRARYTYWDERWPNPGQPGEKPARPGFDWKDTYVQRRKIDRSVNQQINSILSSQAGRIEKSAAIVDFGYHAKDELVRNTNIHDDAEDVLARRFYSKAVLGTLHHDAAVQVWSKISKGQDVPLEKALAAFDMFISEDNEGDFDAVSRHLDDIANQIRDAQPDLDDQCHRQRAVKIAKFLRDNGFTGVKAEAEYHALPHNFIGISLKDQEHQCLPLINVAIFCCVAQRLGLDAHPCGFPFHVHAVINARDGCDLDGREMTATSNATMMYMDPWNTFEEKPVEELIYRLKEMKVGASNHALLLGASSVADIVRRTARNIFNSVNMLDSRPGAIQIDTVNPDRAYNAALWALLLLTEQNSIVHQSRLASELIKLLERLFNLDVPLFVKHILPVFRGRDIYEPLSQKVSNIRMTDEKPKQPKQRDLDGRYQVKYRVGQVFKHKRYSYQAVITGWDKQCEMGELWEAQMGVRNLPNGSNQAFYHALVEDKSMRYVAEENIDIRATDGISPTLMEIAGQYFKRWDEQSKTFISNIRDEYPDD